MNLCDWSSDVCSSDLTPWTVAYQAPPSMDFPGKSAGVDCHFLLQGGLPDPGIEPGSPALWADALPSEPPGKSLQYLLKVDIIKSRRRQWYPTPVLLPGKSMDGGAWWAAVHGVAKSQTQLSY